MGKRLMLCLCCILCTVAGKAQDGNYSAAGIPEELCAGADAVMRYSSMDFKMKSVYEATERVVTVVTVLNGRGNVYADFGCYTDMCSRIKSFKGTLYDSSGKAVRKYGKSDLLVSELFYGLASDMQYHIIDVEYPSYPYTVRFEYEIEHKQGIMAPPGFYPVQGYRLGVERAEYRLSLPEGAEYYVYAENMSPDPVSSEKRLGLVCDTYVLENFKPVDREPMMPRDTEVLPRLIFSCRDFSYHGIPGNMDSWASYAEWQWKLLDGRDAMPEELKKKVHELTDSVPDELGKVRALYDYLGQTTRYVLIAIGIGGLQPMTAQEVYDNKFGDCKGLTNYMKTMLDECGIESYYTEIGSGKKYLNDFASPYFSNHAILCVPLRNDTLWIECTAPNLPLGYVHTDIADRKALVYHDRTATLVDIPAYPDSVNTVTTSAEVRVAADGTAHAEAARTYAMTCYEYTMSLEHAEQKQLVDYAATILNVPSGKVESVVYTPDKSACPSAVLEFDASMSFPVMGDRMILDAYPFGAKILPRLSRNRVHDIVIEDGYRTIDTVRFRVPAGYRAEVVPSANVETPFGRCVVTVEECGDEIVAYRFLQLNSGRYPKDMYGEFKEFVDRIGGSFDSKIVLRRNTDEND